MISICAFCTVLAVTTSDPPPFENALSLQLWSFLSSGVTVQYEREVMRRLSLANSLSYRFSGGEAFDTRELGGGLEGRFWFLGRGMLGPYAGLRFDYSFTHVSDSATDRLLGSSMNFGQSVVFGVRVIIAHRLELTPMLGLGTRQELDPRGRLEPLVRFDVLRGGMTFGLMF